MVDQKRELLRHLLAALTYRTQMALRGAPPEVGAFRASDGVCTPSKLVCHMTSPVLFALAAGACGVERVECPSDAALRASFATHRAALERLAQMAREDTQVHRVAPNFVLRTGGNQDDSAIDKARWDQYRRLFREAGVREGLLRQPRSRGSLQLLCYTEGMLDSGFAKGYAYSAQPPEPDALVASLDDLHSLPRGTPIAFVALEGGWYLFADLSE